MVKLDKIYTRGGDSGKTSLGGGERGGSVRQGRGGGSEKAAPIQRALAWNKP